MPDRFRENGLRVRDAVAGDVPAVAAVVNAAYAIETFIEGTRTDADEVAALRRRGEFLVAEDRDGRIVASVYVERRGERGYFGMLSVDPARQGIGLGRLMVRAAEERCRDLGLKHVDITVLSQRAELLPFYGKLGYAPIGEEPFPAAERLKAGVSCFCIVLSKEV